MEPMLPQTSRSEMADLTCEILRLSGQLGGQVSVPINRDRIVSLVREMNSYYSNLIEGHKTLPSEIEAALRRDYSVDENKRANQHLARAHIEVEELMRRRLELEPELCIHSPEFLCWLHGEFYQKLPEELRYSKDVSGNLHRIEPGVFRSTEVTVGSHQPPHHGSLPTFSERFRNFFSNPQILSTNQLVALAAAHHRLAWIHPFLDGNGRVTRLYSHAWLIRSKADGFGLWTLSRGLARQKDEYYQRLSNADRRRLNDYDGRGNLTCKGLTDFCLYFLRIMLDQIGFMSELLQLGTLAARIERHLQIDLIHLEGKEQERLSRLLKAALFEGEIERGRVGGIVGLGSTAARAIIRLALKEKLMTSPTEKAPLSLVFSSKNLPSYFPQFYQDLPVSAD